MADTGDQTEKRADEGSRATERVTWFTTCTEGNGNMPQAHYHYRISPLPILACLSILAAHSHRDTLCAEAQSAGSRAARTALDTRRIELIRMMNQFYETGAEDPALPTPNLALRGEEHDSAGHYLIKSAAVFALADIGEAPESRIDEANRHLRYMLHKWPVRNANDVVGRNATVLNHAGRTVFIRTYALYSHYFDEDVKEVFDQRLEFYSAPPYERSSENIRMTRNASQFLAHELAGKTALDSYQSGKQWLMPTMESYLRDGPHEWGRFYLEWTMGAVLNLAEFSQDTEVRRLATMVIDYYLALLSGFVVEGNFASGSVRSWGWSLSHLLPQSFIVHNLFPEHHELLWGTWPVWIISNYRPLQAVSLMHANREPLETGMSTGTARKWRHHAYRSQDFIIASHQAPKNGSFRLPTGGTHDIYGIHVQSAKSPRNCVIPFGCIPLAGPSKQRSLMNRYFTYNNVGFAQTGGTTRAVWAGGGEFPGTPIRLFYHFDFEHEIERGWAFLTDGTIYVAWSPAHGEPQLDEETTQRSTDERYGGIWLKSTHVPDIDGEACVLEVGDGLLFGSYGEFKEDILRRNPDPAWKDARLVYRARDGAVIDFGADYVKVNGVEFDPDGYPRADMPGLHDLTITAGGAKITFDVENASTAGDLQRVPTGIVFGGAEMPGPQPPGP